MAGFGGHRRIHTPRIEVLAEHLPVVVEFIESPAKVEELLPALTEMVTDGLIEVQETTVMKAGIGESKGTEPGEHVRRQGPARMMRVFIGEADRWHGEPLYEAIVKRLRELEISGATVYRGIMGYGAKGHTHKEDFWHLSKDVPVMLTVIDSAEKLSEAAIALESMIADGLIVFSDVEIVRLGNPHATSQPR